MTGLDAMSMRLAYTVVLVEGLNGSSILLSLHHTETRAVVVVGTRCDLPARSRRWRVHYMVPDGEHREDDVTVQLRRSGGSQRAPLTACSDRVASLLQNPRPKLERHYALLVPKALITATLNDKPLQCEAVARCGVLETTKIIDLKTPMADALECPIAFSVILTPHTFEAAALLGARTSWRGMPRGGTRSSRRTGASSSTSSCKRCWKGTTTT